MLEVLDRELREAELYCEVRLLFEEFVATNRRVTASEALTPSWLG
jgi:hypothetical protein